MARTKDEEDQLMTLTKPQAESSSPFGSRGQMSKPLGPSGRLTGAKQILSQKNEESETSNVVTCTPRLSWIKCDKETKDDGAVVIL
jgi:hypothetical protein